LLLLDEPTSALDSETERDVMDAVHDLRGGTTIVAVAHRLSAVRNADVIHVIDGGRRVQTGTWAEVTEPGTVFAALWAMQTEERPGSRRDGPMASADPAAT
jgi:ABC-type bacteriocin/lantibiotic exporter with double-glycine peptidase domain